jgi:hypothetical protein
VGDVFVVSDAGGGTVDLITYEVVTLQPNLQLREIVPGSGGMAGSLGLNRRFEEAVKKLVGEAVYAELRDHKGYSNALRMFDRDVKRSFSGEPDEEYYVSFMMAGLDDKPDAGLEGNHWTMKRYAHFLRMTHLDWLANLRQR